VSATVFVYGTLLNGLERHRALEGALYAGSALVKAELHDFGGYPGITKGASSVIGGDVRC
jgi:gamma-glutamylcyclotransferase (GGCT)/AIG2-like uncharacterized protein YtfP